MTLVSQIINDGYRESNLIAIGTAPSGEQAEEALVLINRIIKSVYGNEVGDQLQSMPIGRNNIQQPSGWPYYAEVPAVSGWFVPPNTRLILNLQEDVQVFLHPAPQDGSRFSIIDKSNNLATNTLTVYGNGQTIEGQLNVLFDDNADNYQYLYRADTGNWAKVSPLDTSDDMPFPDEFDDYFAIALAMRLNPRYETAMAGESVAAFKRMDKQLKARYNQVIAVGSEAGLVLTPGTNRYRRWDYGSSTDLFNSGAPWPYGPY